MCLTPRSFRLQCPAKSSTVFWRMTTVSSVTSRNIERKSTSPYAVPTLNKLMSEDLPPFTSIVSIVTILFQVANQFLCNQLFNPLKPELNSICYLLALLAHHFLHVCRIRVKSLTFRRLMSYMYMEHPFLMFLDHTQRRSTVGRTSLDE